MLLMSTSVLLNLTRKRNNDDYGGGLGHDNYACVAECPPSHFDSLTRSRQLGNMIASTGICCHWTMEEDIYFSHFNMLLFLIKKWINDDELVEAVGVLYDANGWHDIENAVVETRVDFGVEAINDSVCS